MTKGHAQVPQHRRVRQVTLQSADGQLFCKVLQHGIGHPPIAFGIFKINGFTLWGIALLPTSPALIFA